MANLDFNELREHYKELYSKVAKQDENDRQLLHVQNQNELRALIQEMEKAFPKKADVEDSYIMHHAYSCVDENMISPMEKSRWLKHAKSYLRKFEPRTQPNNDDARLEFIARKADKMTDSNEERFSVVKTVAEKFDGIKTNPEHQGYKENKSKITTYKEKHAGKYYRDIMNEAKEAGSNAEKEQKYEKALKIVKHMNVHRRMAAGNDAFDGLIALCPPEATGTMMEIGNRRFAHICRTNRALPLETRNAKKRMQDKYR